jgi:hypothetical protein
VWNKALRRPVIWSFVAMFGVLAGAGLWWFQPWKLVTDTVVDEALPVVATSAPRGAPATRSATVTSPAVPGNQVLAAGTLISHEHETTGTAQIVRLADGRRQLLLRDLHTSNGPDLRLWLTDQPVIHGRAGWRVFDDGRWVELARLKGNRGDQAYEIPASADLATLRSVTIWCRRFAVSFGAAELETA